MLSRSKSAFSSIFNIYINYLCAHGRTSLKTYISEPYPKRPGPPKGQSLLFQETPLQQEAQSVMSFVYW